MHLVITQRLNSDAGIIFIVISDFLLTLISFWCNDLYWSLFIFSKLCTVFERNIVNRAKNKK